MADNGWLIPSHIPSMYGTYVGKYGGLGKDLVEPHAFFPSSIYYPKP